MSWPWQFVDLGDDEKLLRRELLDRYGSYAQLSAVVPVFGYQLYRLARWVASERKRAKPDYSAIPNSSVAKDLRESSSASVITTGRSLLWWLEGDVATGMGSRGRFFAALIWTSWLIFLSTHQTGNDYLHVTKRFGIVAASQFPIHYMLSMKSLYSPLAIAFQTSHENLNSYHRVLGRIIYLLLLFHTLFYLNFFIQSGILLKRLSAFVVILGVLAFFLLNVLSTTALSSVRRWSYRVFFILHLTIGVTMLPILFFHAAPLRLYVLEALVLFVLDIIARRLNTITAFSVITAIPQTKLIKLTVPIPTSRIGRFKKAAGQHVYLSIPPQSTQTKPPLPSIHDILFNPFTVAEVSSTSITLILRIHNGPTTSALEHLTHLPKAHPPMNIEGPYGSARKFPNFATNYDRILLIAGGVGASFIVPTYRKIEETLASEQLPADKVNFIWTTRSIAETPWALAEDANVKIYTTGKGPRRGGGSSQTGDNEVGVELEGVGKPSDIQFKGRPDFRSIVDETFRHNDAQKVAILVCGPDGMGNEVRKHVGRWVGKGREVFWHDETFGW